MKITEIRQILDREQIRLTKSLGQNFLHDQNQLRRITAAADLAAGDSVLEIGPGLGSLTEHLLASGSTVFAIEKDRRLFQFLCRRYESHERLTLIRSDALDYLKQRSESWANWKCVSNLPYSVASPILVELTRTPDGPRRIVATLQMEVARRLKAVARESDYGILSLLVQSNYEVRGFLRIAPACFFPAPNVDSACVTLVKRGRPVLGGSELESFRKVVKRGFSQRRKMMIKLLKTDWNPHRVDAVFANLGLAAEIRAEAVTLDQFVQITRELNKLSRKNA